MSLQKSINKTVVSAVRFRRSGYNTETLGALCENPNPYLPENMAQNTDPGSKQKSSQAYDSTLIIFAYLNLHSKVFDGDTDTTHKSIAQYLSCEHNVSYLPKDIKRKLKDVYSNQVGRFSRMALVIARLWKKIKSNHNKSAKIKPLHDNTANDGGAPENLDCVLTQVQNFKPQWGCMSHVSRQAEKC